MSKIKQYVFLLSLQNNNKTEHSLHLLSLLCISSESLQQKHLLIPFIHKTTLEGWEKSFFIHDTVYVIKQEGLKSDAQYISTYDKKLLGLYELEKQIGYSRAERLCRKSIIVLVDSKERESSLHSLKCQCWESRRNNFTIKRKTSLLGLPLPPKRVDHETLENKYKYTEDWINDFCMLPCFTCVAFSDYVDIQTHVFVTSFFFSFFSELQTSLYSIQSSVQHNTGGEVPEDKIDRFFFVFISMKK